MDTRFIGSSRPVADGDFLSSFCRCAERCALAVAIAAITRVLTLINDGRRTIMPADAALLVEPRSRRAGVGRSDETNSTRNETIERDEIWRADAARENFFVAPLNKATTGMLISLRRDATFAACKVNV